MPLLVGITTYCQAEEINNPLAPDRTKEQLTRRMSATKGQFMQNNTSPMKIIACTRKRIKVRLRKERVIDEAERFRVTYPRYCDELVGGDDGGEQERRPAQHADTAHQRIGIREPALQVSGDERAERNAHDAGHARYDSEYEVHAE